MEAILRSPETDPNVTQKRGPQSSHSYSLSLAGRPIWQPGPAFCFYASTTLTMAGRLRYPYNVLENYLADGAYRFQMKFGRGSLADFYRPTPERDELLTERRHWLATVRDQHLFALPEAAPLLAETLELAEEHETIPGPQIPSNLQEPALFLGQNWEPDYLLLTRQRAEIRLVCGCVCFPSSWSLIEKAGQGIEEIHEIVPGLNSALGRQIHTFLERLRPGTSWTRSNWGLSRSAERNQHPARQLRRLGPDVRISEVFFRVEEQSLVALPRTNGILFGIRIKVFPLSSFPGTAAGRMLKAALETMPEALAAYKGLASSRSKITELLEG